MDTTIPDEYHPDSSKAHLMMSNIGVFEGGKKQTVDSHGMFDSTYFIYWMQKLLDSVETISMQNAVIVMENEKYHKSLPDNAPKASCNKHQLVGYCLDKGLDLEENDLETVIWVRIKLYIRDYVMPVS